MPSADPARDSFRVDPAYQPLVRAVGLDADGVFADPRIKVWRRLADRENCTLDAEGPAGAAELTDGGEGANGGGGMDDRRPVRLHVKRYPAPAGGPSSSAGPTPADDERDGHQLLVDAGVPTAPLVAWGVLADRRSFTVWADLAGYAPGDKRVAGGLPFERLLAPTADLAARLHAAGLHHRDLYLCHFMARADAAGGGETVAVDDGVGDGPGPAPSAGAADVPPAVSLIDVARVRELPAGLLGVFTRRRWVVKDLAQFWFSTTRLPVTDDQRDRWLARYCQSRGDGTRPADLRPAVLRKVRSIARHDARLNAKQPGRNVSIPGT